MPRWERHSAPVFPHNGLQSTRSLGAYRGNQQEETIAPILRRRRSSHCWWDDDDHATRWFLKDADATPCFLVLAGKLRRKISHFECV